MQAKAHTEVTEVTVAAVAVGGLAELAELRRVLAQAQAAGVHPGRVRV